MQYVAICCTSTRTRFPKSGIGAPLVFLCYFFLVFACLLQFSITKKQEKELKVILLTDSWIWVASLPQTMTDEQTNIIDAAEILFTGDQVPQLHPHLRHLHQRMNTLSQTVTEVSGHQISGEISTTISHGSYAISSSSSSTCTLL